MELRQGRGYEQAPPTRSCSGILALLCLCKGKPTDTVLVPHGAYALVG